MSEIGVNQRKNCRLQVRSSFFGFKSRDLALNAFPEKTCHTETGAQ
jgi:hypothetical protein